MVYPIARSSTSCSRQSCREYRGGPKRLLEVPIGFFCPYVLLHELCDTFVLVDKLLLQPSDLLLHHHSNPLMDLRWLNR